MKTILLFLAILTIKTGFCFSQKTNLKADTCVLKDYSYDSLLKYQTSGCIDNRWPFNFKVDLNNDELDEEFLLFDTYSRGGIYFLYTRINKKWTMISDSSGIYINHFGPEKQNESIDGWNTFYTHEKGDVFSWIWKKDKYIFNGQIYDKINDIKDSIK